MLDLQGIHHSLRFLSVVAWSALVIVGTCLSAQAWTRVYTPDPWIIASSDLIVIGQLELGSAVCITVNADYDYEEAEHRAVLKVTECLTGTMTARLLPIRIATGLIPTVGGQHESHGVAVHFEALLGTGTSREIHLADDVQGEGIYGPVSQPHLWFLRRELLHVQGPKDGVDPSPIAGHLGIDDPCQVWPLKYLDYLRACLSPKCDEAISAVRARGKPVRWDDEAELRSNWERDFEVPPVAPCPK